ncbi:MAG: hypothetical protein MAG451_00795 [Anaerolineales bacterium]|nr:hypothetical protein [Anaerolineales bacterium]
MNVLTNANPNVLPILFSSQQDARDDRIRRPIPTDPKSPVDPCFPSGNDMANG